MLQEWESMLWVEHSHIWQLCWINRWVICDPVNNLDRRMPARPKGKETRWNKGRLPDHRQETGLESHDYVHFCRKGQKSQQRFISPRGSATAQWEHGGHSTKPEIILNLKILINLSPRPVTCLNHDLFSSHFSNWNEYDMLFFIPPLYCENNCSHCKSTGETNLVPGWIAPQLTSVI